MGVKRCRNCGEVKRSQEFRRDTRCRDGLSSCCAECHVEATRAYRQRRREAEAEATWKAIKAHSEELRRWEAEATCARRAAPRREECKHSKDDLRIGERSADVDADHRHLRNLGLPWHFPRKFSGEYASH